MTDDPANSTYTPSPDDRPDITCTGSGQRPTTMRRQILGDKRTPLISTCPVCHTYQFVGRAASGRVVIATHIDARKDDSAEGKMKRAFDDPRLRVAFWERPDSNDATVITAKAMVKAGLPDHPVLVIPAHLRSHWEANLPPGRPPLPEYTGELPIGGDE